MAESTTPAVVRRGTPRTSLTALGLKLRQLDLFGPLRTTVQIPQKTVRYAPQNKLYAAFIGLLCGAQGLVELNGRVRPPMLPCKPLSAAPAVPSSRSCNRRSMPAPQARDAAGSGADHHLPPA